MRVQKAFCRILKLPATRVVDVQVWDAQVEVVVALRRRSWMACPRCEFRTRSRYDTRPVSSRWRTLDVAGLRCFVTCRLYRICCPEHKVVTEQVPFARPDSGFTVVFEQLCAWLAARADKSMVARFLRIDWKTVGRVCTRVVADQPAGDRFDRLVAIGVDEISWRKHHRYLTLVCDHRTGKVIWGRPGKDTATLDRFFAGLGADQRERIRAVSMDMGPAFAKSVRANLPQAQICFDPFHVVQLITNALEEFRRAIWRELRKLPNPQWAKRFKGARWVLLKGREKLTADQQITLAAIRKSGGALWRAYLHKESLRKIFAGDLTGAEAEKLLVRWCSRACRSRIPEFVKASRTIRKHLPGIVAAIDLGLSNARQEGLNTKARLIFRRAYGFHSAEAALALVMLACGPVETHLPWEQPA